MNESTITVQGYVGAEPTLRTAGSHPVANFRVACTPRRLDRATGTWIDAPTQWYTVNAWRQLGENVARSLRKGDPIVVHGRLVARSYVTKDGLEVDTFEIEASVVGHDLNRGCSVLTKNERSTHHEQAQRDGSGQPIGDPPGFAQPRAEEAPLPAA